MQTSILAFLEQVRATAQSGLHYAENPYDRDRYQRLFDLSLKEYASLTDVDIEVVRGIFLRDSGVVTPKTAACGAVFDETGQLLLVRRADNGRVTLPGGACEPGESPQETAVREVREETGLTVEAHEVIDVFCGKAGTHNRVVTFHSAMCYCTVVLGEMHATIETTQVGFYDYTMIPDEEWHQDTKLRAQRAHDFWLRSVRTD